MDEDNKVYSRRQKVERRLQKIIRKAREKVTRQCSTENDETWYKERMKHLGRVQTRIDRADLRRLYIIGNQLQNLPIVDSMVTKVENLISKKIPTLAKDGADLKQKLLNIISKNLFSDAAEREVCDTLIEIQRTQLQIELFDLLTEEAYRKLTFSKDDNERLATIKFELGSSEMLSEEEIAERRDFLRCMRRNYSLTKEEKMQIVKAMKKELTKKGHWFKCPKGHIYAIGECGGAMQRAICPECGSSIGGANHCLEDGNTIASEMDGAQYAAWSEQANMANYGFD